MYFERKTKYAVSLGAGETEGLSIRGVTGRIALAGLTGLVTGLTVHYTSKPKTYVLDEKTARDIARTVSEMDE